MVQPVCFVPASQFSILSHLSTLKVVTLHQTELNRIFRLVAPATIAGALPNEIEQKVLDSFYVSVSVVKDSANLRKGGCNVSVMRMIFFFSKKALYENRGTAWFIR